MEFVHDYLEKLLAKGYVQHMRNDLITSHYQPLGDQEVLNMSLNHQKILSFPLNQSDFMSMGRNLHWISSEGREAFKEMTALVNTSIFKTKSKIKKTDLIIVVMAIHPPYYHLGKQIATIADPTNNFAMSGALVEVEGKTHCQLSCLWGIKIIKGRRE